MRVTEQRNLRGLFFRFAVVLVVLNGSALWLIARPAAQQDAGESAIKLGTDVIVVPVGRTTALQPDAATR